MAESAELACTALQPVHMALEDEEDDWNTLPQELLEIIGANLSANGADLANASMVCKSWSESIAAGLTSMDLDMHCDPTIWQAKVAKLRGLLLRLRSAHIHINASITDSMLCQNLALLQQLNHITELKLHLRDHCELPPLAASALGSMTQLEALSVQGGTMSREAVAALLRGLVSVPGLARLQLLPGAHCGLGDDDVAALLAAGDRLEVLEFRACRLTSAGLEAMSLGLPRLQRLAITSLDSDSGYELACLERLRLLQQLRLALDHAPLGGASRSALCSLKPGNLSLSFKWTDRAHGLLREVGGGLANLTQLDMGACRVSTEAVFEAVAQLTGLRELRMAVYSNADHAIPCHLSRLSGLAALQKFYLEKRRAYFPEARRFCESSIHVPLTSRGLQSLAGRWGQLRTLRLALSRADFSNAGLSVLSRFTSLRELGLLVDTTPAAVPPAPVGGGGGLAAGPSAPAAEAEAEADAEGDGDAAAECRGLIGLPAPTLDLACLPAGLTSLEVNSICLELSTALEGPSEAGHSLLSGLEVLDLEGCLLRQAELLPFMAANMVPRLRVLRLVDVAGLTDAALGGLSSLTELCSLTVNASGNRAVTQASLAALSRLRRLRHLSWESGDLTAGGPHLASLAHFTSLRYLWLSCSERTADLALQAQAAAAGVLVPGLQGGGAVPALPGGGGGSGARQLDGLALLQAALPYCYVDMVRPSRQV